MRIAILTQPLRYNYGGILQNYALQTVLRRMGHDVLTLDPPRFLCPNWKYPYYFFRHVVSKYISGHRDVSLFTEYSTDKETKILGSNTFCFIDNYIKRVEYNAKQIKSGKYDAFVVGSDQVWRCRYNKGRIRDMFLDFTNGWNVKRISYAASFGTDKWEGDDITTAYCSKAIRDFDLVTVRESSGIDICQKVFNIKAKQVLDPTLLLEKEDYIKLIRNNTSVDKIKGDFYLYILDKNEEIKKLIGDIVEHKGMKPYSCHGLKGMNKTHSSLKRESYPPVELWLKGFEQAKVVLTDSFHGCVFSILFRRQFYLYVNNVRGMERYLSLFNTLGIDNRIVHTIEDFNKIKDIDYDELYRRLSFFRDYSLNLLKEALY